ncbi:hybrid sensor histidine kinase/response regulator [Burkholderia sp. BCC1999]|uniref:hybrid sensor histidine kinase/response regulator n=1 Tax=Burkholderia sp. BCC1999 TaxID=2817448 RepID=UPI002AC36C55|nr:ATP-binding protein [Burkholderia sp. BCC1999]
MPVLSQTLDELRRYHRLLMAGARWAAVLGILIALLAEVLVLVRTYVSDQRQMFTVAHRLVRGRIVENEHSFLNGLVRAELSWDDERAIPRSLVERFRTNSNLLYWKPFPTENLELAIAGAPGVSLDDATIERYLQFASQIGRANIATSKVLGRQVTQFFFSPDRRIVSILPSSAIFYPERLKDDTGRAAFINELANGAVHLADGTSAPASCGPKNVHWSSSLYLLPDGDRMLRLAAPVMLNDRAAAVLVNEIDPDDLIWPVASGGYGGVFAIVDDAGEILATAAHFGPGNPLRELVTRWRRTHSIDTVKPGEQYYDNRMIISQRLCGTGYTLIYTYSWRDIAAAVCSKALSAAIVLASVLVAIWFLLYLLNRRIFLPMYARSEQVFESERLSRTVIETVPVGIGLVSTGSGELLYGGSSLATLTELVDGGTPRLLTELTTRYARIRSQQRAASDAQVFQEDVSLPTRDGDEIALQARFALGRYLGEDVLVTAFVDVTTSQRLAQQLRDAKLAADQANAAKSTFLAAMSHEIRTPLNAILGNLELLAHSPMNALQRDRLRTIRASSNGLLAIIQDVLDFSKIEAGAMQFEQTKFFPTDVMTRALAMFAPVAEAKGIALYGTFGISIDQPMRGDPARLAQVVQNLLSNAIKFTVEGKVTLAVGYEAPSRDARVGGTLVMSVSDTGIGIDAAQRERLFNAFTQADSSISRRFGGTGLGLALCQRLVAGMGGSIGFEGEAGNGSRFTVRVPLDRTGVPVVPDARIFAGQRVTLLAAADEWHAYAVPVIEVWGAVVEAVRHPDEMAEGGAGALIICGDRGSWSAESENRVVEDSAAVVICSFSGPLQPVRVGRVLSVSCYSPAGLRTALEHLLNGTPLAVIDGAHAAGTANCDDAPAQRLGLRILVAEDNEVNRHLLDEQLTLLGCKARLVTDGVDALQALSDETFDLVLTDLNMPRMDGYVLARIMRARWPNTPIVAVTADATVDERRRCAELGVHAVASKPLSLDGLARVLSLAMDGVEHGASDDGDGALVGGHPMSPALVATFRESFAKSREVLKAALARGDERAMLAELHSLKGALGIFQQRDLGQQCGALEQRIKSAGLGQARAEWRAFDDVLAAFLADDSH